MNGVRIARAGRLSGAPRLCALCARIVTPEGPSAAVAERLGMLPLPNPDDVAELAHLLTLVANFASADQAARFIISSNWGRNYAGVDVQRAGLE